MSNTSSPSEFVPAGGAAELTGLAQSVTHGSAWKKLRASVAGTALACLGLARPAIAAAPSYTTLDYPGAIFTDGVGINRFGDIVGHYVDKADVDHGYLLHKKGYTTIDFPGSAGGHVHDINSSGAIVGQYFLGEVGHAFLFSGGTYTNIDFPRSQTARANGINTAGDIVGAYTDNNTNHEHMTHGFLLRRAVFSSIDFPGATYTEAWRINDNGQIVGRYKDARGNFHAYMRTNANFTSIDYPGATQTAMGDVGLMGGLNNKGELVSGYCSSSSSCEVGSTGALHGFLLRAGSFTSLDIPGATGTAAFGINDQGDIVGGYTDANSRVHGFLRTMP
jgi:uncharacterized membrane protein